MKKNSENQATINVINFADVCRFVRQAKAENPNATEDELFEQANDLMMTVPLLGDADNVEQEPQMILEFSKSKDERDAVLDEVLSSMGTLIRPTAQPTPKEVEADPDAFVVFRREELAPYFDDDSSAEYIKMLVITLLEVDRIRNE